jgi:hypothetical protein
MKMIAFWHIALCSLVEGTDVSEVRTACIIRAMIFKSFTTYLLKHMLTTFGLEEDVNTTQELCAIDLDIRRKFCRTYTRPRLCNYNIKRQLGIEM